MGLDPLEKDYGVLLALTCPTLIQRARDYRTIAEIVGSNTLAGKYMLSQAQRAEDSIKAIGRKFNERRR